MNFLPELLQQNFQNSETDNQPNKKIHIRDHFSHFGVWGSIIATNTCVPSDLESSAARVADAFMHIYELYNMVLLAWRPNTPLSMPVWMLQYQLRQARHACCLPIPLWQLPQASGILHHREVWSPAHPSTTSSQENHIPGGLKAYSRDCTPRTNDTEGLFLFCVPSEFLRSI